MVACLTERPLFASVERSPSVRARATLGRAVPLRLRTGGRVHFLMSVDFVQGPASTESSSVELIPAGYWYHVTEADGREILAYHWHPDGATWMRAPHVHLSSRIPSIPISGGDAVSLADMHLPTGFVAVSDIVRLLITDFRVVPRREDWEIVLASNE